MSGKAGMNNVAPRVQQAAELVDIEMLDLCQRLARWPGDRRTDIGQLVARARTLAGRAKRLETRHTKTIDAVIREGTAA